LSAALLTHSALIAPATPDNQRMGKTFQTELALKKLGAEAVVMSAGVCGIHEGAPKHIPGCLSCIHHKRLLHTSYFVV